MNNQAKYILIVLAIFTANIGNSQVVTPDNGKIHADSIRVSLLTCSPGKEIYSIFGHTAIRYENSSQGIDWVFNYGIFSFDTPNFIWRFVKGETDYKLGLTEYEHFAAEYAFRNRIVWQQNLNLTSEEKDKLINLLQLNYQPSNRVYRYNFFFDNCATRPRDKIEESINGKVIYKEINNRQTFRDIVHEASHGYDWERFGMDFCLGIKADHLISYREEMFSPIYLMEAFAHASIVDSEKNERALVDGDIQEVVPKLSEESPPHTTFTPFRCFLLLFIILAGITIYGLKKKKSLWVTDLILFTAAGLSGCVVALLSFFSEHPAVSPNYLIFAFHPLHLLFLPFFLRKEIKGLRSWYHTLNCTVLTLFIILWPIIPQYFNPAVLPLALSLLLRSASNLVLTYKRNK